MTLDYLAKGVYDQVCGDITPNQARDAAKFVLTSIRGATNAQYAVGFDALNAEHGCLFSAYTAMIDAILGEGEEE
jgi:hypothetical protein